MGTSSCSGRQGAALSAALIFHTLITNTEAFYFVFSNVHEKESEFY